MTSATPRPYQVVYDTDNGLQYVFETGNIVIPEAGANSITSLTGDVTAAGPGASVATIAVGVVTTAKLANASVTPAKISIGATDDFTFPRDVTAGRDIIATRNSSAAGSLINTGNTTQLGNSSTGQPNVKIISSLTGQASLTFNGGGTDYWGWIKEGSAFNNRLDLFDEAGSAFVFTAKTGSGITIPTMYGSIGLNETNSTAAASAKLDVASTTQGFLPPRMTTTQRNAIASPAEGLIVYDTTLHQLWEYQNGTWAEVGGGGGGTPGGSDTQVQFNNSGSFGGSANLTFDGTHLRLANDNQLIFGNSDQAFITFDSSTNTTLIETVPIGDANLSAIRNFNIVANLRGTGLPAIALNDNEHINLATTSTVLASSGPTDSPTSASAILEAQSTTQGFLPPVMTTTQKNAISSPATGLVVFDSTLGKLCVFSTTWQTITSV